MEEYRRHVLMSKAELSDGLDALAVRLHSDLDHADFTVVAILGGSVIFAADLIRRLRPGLVLDFLRIQTYGDATSPQHAPQADWLPNPANIRGRKVLLLDDILDTGRTMAEAKRVLLQDLGAESVHVVVLVDKLFRRAAPVEADDCVVRVSEDLFLVGYGLDLAGRYRNLPQLMSVEAPEPDQPDQAVEAGAAAPRSLSGPHQT